MGCFSSKCKGCNTPVNSDSLIGEYCNMYFLKEGQVIEQKQGHYNSYGATLESGEWHSMDWSDVCELMFSDDKSNGIAVYHNACDPGVPPTERFEDDPEQGWGKIRKRFM